MASANSDTYVKMGANSDVKAKLGSAISDIKAKMGSVTSNIPAKMGSFDSYSTTKQSAK